jgi:hypothetical protein
MTQERRCASTLQDAGSGVAAGRPGWDSLGPSQESDGNPQPHVTSPLALGAFVLTGKLVLSQPPFARRGVAGLRAVVGWPDGGGDGLAGPVRVGLRRLPDCLVRLGTLVLLAFVWHRFDLLSGGLLPPRRTRGDGNGKRRRRRGPELSFGALRLGYLPRIELNREAS